MVLERQSVGQLRHGFATETIDGGKNSLNYFIKSPSIYLPTFQVSHAISRIYAPEDLESRVLLLSSEGNLTVTDAELNVCGTHNIPNADSRLVECFVFSRKACTFLPSRTAPPRGTIVILFLQI
jgi:hypothetical protein